MEDTSQRGQGKGEDRQNRHQRPQEIVTRYTDGYRQQPETDEEAAAAHQISSAAVHALLSQSETEAPEEYQDWERQYLSEKAAHGCD
jgi:hypothetical protein